MCSLESAYFFSLTGVCSFLSPSTAKRFTVEFHVFGCVVQLRDRFANAVTSYTFALVYYLYLFACFFLFVDASAFDVWLFICATNTFFFTLFKRSYEALFAINVFHPNSFFCLHSSLWSMNLGEHPAAMQHGCAANNINLSIMLYVTSLSLLIQLLNRILSTSIVLHVISP